MTRHGRRTESIWALIRYAAEFVVLSRTRREAKRAMKGIRLLLERLKLQLYPQKTKLVCRCYGQEGFDFLEFHFRKAKARRRHWYYPKHWSSRKAQRAIRQKVRTVTGPRYRLKEPVSALIQEINRKIRSWAAYYGYGTDDSGAWIGTRVQRALVSIQEAQGASETPSRTLYVDGSGTED